MNDEDILADSIVKSFAYAENGGKPDIENPVAGKTGEMKSIFQFTPDTWKKDSQQFLGRQVDISPDAETYVMKQKVKNWIKQKKTVSQMASIHNAGAGEPEAYTGKFSTGRPSVGINQKYGVKYDVPNYAKKVVEYSKKFYSEKTNPQQSNPQLSDVMSVIKQASNASQNSNN